MTFWDEDYEGTRPVPPIGTRVVFVDNVYDRIGTSLAGMDLVGREGTVTDVSEGGLALIQPDNRDHSLVFYETEYEVLEAP